MEILLDKGWKILQDVHDLGEVCKIYESGYDFCSTSSQFSDWEGIDYLSHLQPYFTDTPYYGRELRYFNIAPWWYKKEFSVKRTDFDIAYLMFKGVDYYCRIWLNGVYIGFHEGYGTPFKIPFNASLLQEENILIAKVWSPWDYEVLPGKENQRVFHVVRSMMKGTYEHDDTFIQRDVNPVGIYDDVSLVLKREVCFDSVRVEYAKADGEIRLAYSVIHSGNVPDELKMKIKIREKESGLIIKEFFVSNVDIDNPSFVLAKVSGHLLWETWERGSSNLYVAKAELFAQEKIYDSREIVFGFRDIEIIRNREETTFVINGEKIFLRGTCYMPDIYISKVSRNQYKRDIQNAKMLGFNAIRVHVHTAKSCFYELCDEYGMMVIQDSDFNWVHEISDDFAKRSQNIFTQVIRHLQSHPSIIGWICMNEPDFIKNRVSVDSVVGKTLWETACTCDPGRPAILASYLGDDEKSGDTHMYLGSLENSFSLYKDILEHPEKLNTEFGIDAPPCVENLRKERTVSKRLSAVESKISEIQYYQYRLVKFYMEKYRLEKYKPCSGYFQFMLIDLSPQSYYGIYDWWAVPKKCVDACFESNAPVGIFIRQGAQSLDFVLVNDLPCGLEDLRIDCAVIDDAGESVFNFSELITIGRDDSLLVRSEDSKKFDSNKNYTAVLKVFDSNGNLITGNFYDNLFYHPPRPEGHPGKMSHELGVRLFNA